MTSRFDLYGWDNSSIREAAEQVGTLLGITLDLHESSYRGGEYYLWCGEGAGELIVQKNFQDEEGLLLDGDHQRFLVLLYASGQNSEWFELLPNLVDAALLRSEFL